MADRGYTGKGVDVALVEPGVVPPEELAEWASRRPADRSLVPDLQLIRPDGPVVPEQPVGAAREGAEA